MKKLLNYALTNILIGDYTKHVINAKLGDKAFETPKVGERNPCRRARRKVRRKKTMNRRKKRGY